MADKKLHQVDSITNIPEGLTGKILAAADSNGKLYKFGFNGFFAWLKTLYSDQNDTTVIGIEAYEGIGLTGSIQTASGMSTDGAIRNYNSNLRIYTNISGLTVESGKPLAICRVKPNLTERTDGKTWMAIPAANLVRASEDAFLNVIAFGRPFLTADTAPDWEICLFNPTASDITLAEGTIDISYLCRFIPVTI